MRIILLGASGQIGTALYQGIRNDHEVVGTSRKNSKHLIKFDPFKDDWSSLGIADILINAVGQIEPSSESTFEHVHVELVERILANRDAIGRPRIIQISALGASPAHKVEFLRTKGIADDLLLQNSDTIIIRPSIVCTPRTVIVKKMLMLAHIARCSLGFLFVPKDFLRTQIQPVMPQDLVDVIKMACVGNPEGVINVVGPDRISFREIISTMAAAMERNIRIIEVPKQVTDRIINHVVMPLFPRMINEQQYQLLFEDNIDNSRPIERTLNRMPQSTKEFFINEFSHARN